MLEGVIVNLALFIFLSSVVLMILGLWWMKNEKPQTSKSQPPRQMTRRRLVRPATKTTIILRCAGQMPRVQFLRSQTIRGRRWSR
jgi:hypothetical protein